MSTALITGASRGFGRALALALAQQHWSLVVDARGRDALAEVHADLLTAGAESVVSRCGSVTDPAHRSDLMEAVAGGLDLLVNNASLLGPSPQPPLRDYPLVEWADVYDTNVQAPLAIVQAALPALRNSGGVVVNISSDAAAEAYEGWGGYGSSKAALDHWTAILGVEEPDLAVYAFDPGDMRTQMHQDAFPGEDISDRPEPETVVPALLRLLAELPVSGRYQAASLRSGESAA